ncbi:amidohydrolase family protein [Herbiconiux sp. VKM Ac-2851]|uniref:amidohydrolase family protein n=1 Tax=Herbiconiux sp. VKM Ac-2851 TaxID=2739025 RepID=UPI001564BAAF|nr:amidohydrolase family protein [Herbiconiux sp. VKM Ac-2851]NQX34524.1 amidohydrolase family protein [Herbiconiux sp. VKM Ac-2851]
MTTTAVTNARIFDGEKLLDATTVLIEDGIIADIGGTVPPGATIVDGSGGTLLPGLIDAHVHTNEQSLGLALRFGVTTELEMQGTNTRSRRAGIAEDDSLADVRSSGFGLTAPGGHPAELFPEGFRPGPPPGASAPSGPRPVPAEVTTPEEATAVVPRLVADGSDYIKFMVDDGSVEGHPGIPMLDQATLNAGVAAAHEHGMLAIAHTLTVEATLMAVEAGVDGLAHLFMDRPHTDEIVAAIADAGIFVTACVVLDASMIGVTGAALADDPRVASRLDEGWDTTLRSSFGHYPQGSIADVLASVKALHDAGVDILVGTDASVPLPFMGGLAHGASVHHELQYLVRAGLTPTEALTAATSATARRFGLSDRGRIAVGLRADLLLVDGDPTSTIADTLNTRAVWRRGALLGA